MNLSMELENKRKTSVVTSYKYKKEKTTELESREY